MVYFHYRMFCSFIGLKLMLLWLQKIRDVLDCIKSRSYVSNAHVLVLPTTVASLLEIVHDKPLVC